MKVVTRGAELIPAVRAATGNGVLVPTMGALHDGHIQLIRNARKLAGLQGTVVVSIFVNPIQFDRADDLEAYPRPIDEDLAKCEAAGVDVVFAPTAAEMYHADRSITVSETQLSSRLCGASRPGHFDGVCTVVLKLFLLSGCEVAVFGEKDFQQLAIIRRMVRDLNVPVRIEACATVREADGLAMSSRNKRLSVEQRRDAPRIRRALCEAAEMEDLSSMMAHARRVIEESVLARIDYLELVDAESLQPSLDPSRPLVLAAAVFYGDVRLIDHVTIGPH